MKTIQIVTVTLGCAGLLAAGCEGGQKAEAPAPEAPAAEAPAAEAPAPAEAAEAGGEPGGIKVTVAFEGTPPPAKPLNRKADPFCAKTPVNDPSVQVKDGKLQNVVVRIAGRVKSDAPVPSEPVKIDQQNCMYAPRVVAVREGQAVEISNGDKTLHNVHAYKGENKENWFNTAQPPNAPVITKEVDSDLVQLKCDVHPWMAAYIASAPHPFVGVTGEDGIVSWDGVPSKSKAYKVETWHEVYGKQEAEVTVEAGKVAEFTVTYKADQAAN